MKEISDDNYQKTFYELFEKRRREVKQLTKTEQKKKIFYYMSRYLINTNYISCLYIG